MTLEREQTPRCALRRLLLGAVLIQIKAAVAPSNSMILVLFRSEGYGDMTGSVSLTTWLSCVMLSAILALGSGVARGQMNADLPHDMDLLEQSISATIAAIDSGDRNAARVAMETLFQDWRRFRRMDFDGAPNDSQFVPDMEVVEARLYAASQQIDRENFADARSELEAARIMLLMVRERFKPAA